ncbi:MAG: L,D-transpeptidase family protein [Muribaculaceae bacterium]|nr:L,D-transpeptidase family protein [Muribaculaceae bacterium]
MNRFTLLLTTLFIISLTACGPSDKTGTADSIVDTTTYDTAMPVDTIPVDTIPPAPGRFATTQEALDYMQNSPYREKYEAGILPRMARENLPYTNKLLNSTYSRFLVVDKGKMKVQVYDCYGRKEIEYGIACAKNFGTKHEKGDSRTPEGFFSVEGIYDSTDWLFTDDNGVTSPKKGQFGPRFIRLRIPTTSQIGIHGTCAPWSIGSRASHGCIRVTNENILKLVEIVEVGMPVIVNPGSRDMRVNLEEGYDVPYITTDDRPIKIPKVIRKDTTNVDSIPMDTVPTQVIEAVDTTTTVTKQVTAPTVDTTVTPDSI